MKFDKYSIGKRIYITGCGINSVCTKCHHNSCIPDIKEGKIYGIIHTLEPTNENDPEMSKVNILVGNSTIHTRRKWCHLIEDDIPLNNTIPENIVEILF